ncbi:MAG TPA: HdeD family acid-resistance protein [Longimicrobium sp.]|nr:HdeD family acid-resistance protein [Longimicrobium sp.]
MTITVNQAASILREAVRERIRERSLLFLIQGGLLVVAGVLALLFPLFFGEGVLMLIGWLLVLSGLVQGLGLIGSHQVPYFWLQMVSGVLGIVVGFLLISRPEAGLLAVALLLVVFFMVEAVARIAFALTIRPMQDWTYLLGSGVVGVIVAMILAANLGTAAHWLLGTLLGVYLVAAGGALGYLAWNLRRAAG